MVFSEYVTYQFKMSGRVKFEKGRKSERTNKRIAGVIIMFKKLI